MCVKLPSCNGQSYVKVQILPKNPCDGWWCIFNINHLAVSFELDDYLDPVKLESNPGSSKKALQQIELTTTSYNEAQTWCKKLDIITFIPVVTRFLCPPEIPRCRSSPTIVSAHTSRPNTCSSNWKVKMAPPVHELSHLGRIIKP